MPMLNNKFYMFCVFSKRKSYFCAMKFGAKIVFIGA